MQITTKFDVGDKVYYRGYEATIIRMVIEDELKPCDYPGRMTIRYRIEILHCIIPMQSSQIYVHEYELKHITETK